MAYAFDERVPIYLQIIDEIKRQLVTNKLKGGDKMPSVRELSEGMEVNPNTVQRAYQELERLGITYTQRGMGTFVTQDEGIIISIKEEMAMDAVRQFAESMQSLGMSPQDTIKCLEDYFEKGAAQ